MKSTISPKPEVKRQRTYQSSWGLLADIIGGIILWSSLTYFPAAMFFYPMVDMSYTGWEVTLIAIFGGSLVGVSSLRKAATFYPFLFRLFSLIGLAGFWVPRLDYRLGVVGFGVTANLLGTFGVLIGSTKERRERGIYGLALGFVALVVIRFAYRSINPFWHSPEASIAMTVLGFLSAIIYYFEGNYAIPTGDKQTTIQDPYAPSAIASAFGMGGNFFILHLLFSVHGAVPRYVELEPFPYGILIILALAIGVWISSYGNVVKNSGYWIVTAWLGWIFFASTAGTMFPPQVELFGGILLGIHATSSLIHVMDKICRTRYAGTAIFIGSGIYVALQLASLYVVAYKFVPGGYLLRERSRSVIFTALFLTGFGHLDGIFSSKFVPFSENVIKRARTILIVILLLGLSPISVYRFLRATEPHHRDFDQISPMIWAIHFGYDNFGGLNHEGLADVIRRSDANLIGLVETDCMRTAMDNRDVVEWLGEELHYWSDYGPSTAQNTWGCAFLSAFPIERAERLVLPSPEGELACLIDADVTVNGTSVRVLITHFGNTEDKVDLEMQTNALIDAVKQREGFAPTIMIGYLTTPPFSERYTRIINKSGLRDSLNSLDRYCEYVFYKDLILTDFIRWDKGNVSDTEAQQGKFVFPTNSEGNIGRAEVIPATPTYCREFYNDSVKCQASISCGWCQLGSQGSCYEPRQELPCKRLNGLWVGPSHSYSSEDSKNNQLVKDFLDIQFQQQSHGLDKVVKNSDGSFTWTFERFAEMNSFTTFYDSPIFAAGEGYYRFALRLPRRWGSLRIELEPIGTADGNWQYKAPATTITLINQKDSSKSISKRTSPAIYSKGTRSAQVEYAGSQLASDNFLVKDTIKFNVKFD